MSNQIKQAIKRVLSRYSRADRDTVKNYIYDNIGPRKLWMREWIPMDPVVEVIIIDKSETCDYLKWATLGMGRKEMRAPEGIPLRCELVMMFPPEINIDNFDDDYRGDVMGWISHYPYLNNDWIGEKRIVDGEDVLPDELPYRGMTFFTIKDSNGQPLNVEISKGEKVAFYYVVPLFRSELEYAKTHSEEELFKLLLKIENPYIFDANREPVV